MKNNQTMIIAALTVDSKNVTLYGTNGDIVALVQGDPRITGIIETARPALLRGEPVEVSLDFKNQNTSYQDMEQQTNGLVRFFRVAKHRLASFFGKEEEEAPATIGPMQLGRIPVKKEPELTNDQKVAAAEKKLEDLGAVSTNSSQFHAPLAESDDTIVAMVGDKVIPDVQHLHNQIRQSVKLQDCAGFTLFMKRLSAVINERRHSVEDLMKFMEKGDLPIADDGCIVIYKRLNSTNEPGVYTDCHTNKIRQKVGSLVLVDEQLVDPDRRQDCSNGLHVASLTYLKHFGGDVTIIGKVRPEDVFAVPQYNTNKMRVCAYHIIAELTEEQRQVVNGGGSICDAVGGQELLNKVLRGEHPPVTQLVRVTKQQGEGVIYTDIADAETPAVSNFKPEVTKGTLDIEATHDDIQESEVVSPTQLVEPEKAKPKQMVPQSRADSIRAVLAEGSSQVTANKLRVIKKKAKKSYLGMGLTAKEVAVIEAMLKQYPAGK